MAVCDLELEGGVSAHIYLSWLHPEKTAKVVVVGRERMLAYEGRFEKRGITLYDYTLDLTPPPPADRGRGAHRADLGVSRPRRSRFPPATSRSRSPPTHFVECVRHRRRAAHQRRPLAPRRRGARAADRAATRGGALVSAGGEARRRLARRLLSLGGAALALLGWLLHHTGFEPVWQRLQVLGWAAPLVLAPVSRGRDRRRARLASTLPPPRAARVPLPAL